MATLPAADRALLDVRKLDAYILNPRHPVGAHKAALFRTLLGFKARDRDALARAILEGVRTAPATVGLTDRYGTRYVADMEIVGPVGTAIVRTGWIIEHGQTEPRFVTAYVR